MEKLIEQFNEWSYFNSLAPMLYGFKLNIEKKQNGTQYCFFSYSNEQLDKSFLVSYDSATKEFIARWRHGLIEFCDVNFIAPDLAALEKILIRRLDDTLRSVAQFEEAALGSVFLGKKIIEWPYASVLASVIHGFSLVKDPRRPLKGINGSYIIIDYSDFSANTNLLIYYNIYRDEFYGEIIFRGTPEMTTLFDADTLPVLEDKLNNHLQEVLADLRQRIDTTL